MQYENTMQVRSAKITDVKAIYSLINYHAERDRMLFRSMADIYKNLQAFRERYSSLDLLLLDDVHLLGNRKRTQEEFLFIFNALYGAKKQMVISGDRPPNQLMKMSSRLKSRLGWGLISEIEVPDQSTKIQIIREKAKEDGISIPDDVIFFLAKSNRDIKGLIKNIVRIETYASLNRGDINISRVKSLIKDDRRKEAGMDSLRSAALCA